MTEDSRGRTDGLGWSFADKAGVVTGGASGLGYETARLLGLRGARVVIADIDGEAALRAVTTLASDGIEARAIGMDVKERDEFKAALELCTDAFGSLDFLHNNAGVLGAARMASVSPDDLEKVFSVNVFGTFWGCRLAIEIMRRQSTRGAIVNTASILAHSGDPLLPVYTASKHAVLGLTRALALDTDVVSSGVRINCVCPADMDTPLNDRYFEALEDPIAGRVELEAQYPIGRMAHPREVAAAVAFLLSDDASFVSGTSVTVDAGLLASAY